MVQRDVPGTDPGTPAAGPVRGVRAAVVVTGTEVLTGRVQDRNGPWLAQRLRDVGVDIGRVVVVGDRPDDLVATLRDLVATHDLVITSGGLGPTADDLTARVVGDVQGRPSVLDPALRDRIAAIVDGLVRRRGRPVDRDALDAGTAKQALVPQGAHVLEPVGTAPGLVVPPADGHDGAPVVVLPGPPSELQGMWPAALAAPAVQALLARTSPLHEDTVRLWGTMESDLAATLRRIGPDLDGLDVCTCLRDGELEIVTRYAPGDRARLDRLRAALLAEYDATLVAADGSTVDDLVATGLAARGWTVATAESCTGGLLGARLTGRAGASGHVLGAVTAYANAAKTALLGVPADLVAAHGAVSPQVAAAMADGARTAFGADVGVGVTGVAGPGGGTPDKPVGTVFLDVVTPDARRARELHLPGTRDDVRRRTVLVALHELRLALR